MNTLDDYIKSLIEITSAQTNIPASEIKINREAVKPYFESGIPPYFCFREEF
jgi:hypothetical protein